MVGPLESDQQRGNMLEDAAYIVCRTNGSVPVVFGHHLAVPPSGLRAAREAGAESKPGQRADLFAHVVVQISNRCCTRIASVMPAGLGRISDKFVVGGG
ncbi:hypothetical protein A5652_01565 [Mycobacterium sp. 1165178.9]|nr:hypothetical protein A5652_01565 [Mycobacterium sp. 1165178.9]